MMESVKKSKGRVDISSYEEGEKYTSYLLRRDRYNENGIMLDGRRVFTIDRVCAGQVLSIAILVFHASEYLPGCLNGIFAAALLYRDFRLFAEPGRTEKSDPVHCRQPGRTGVLGL